MQAGWRAVTCRRDLTAQRFASHRHVRVHGECRDGRRSGCGLVWRLRLCGEWRRWRRCLSGECGCRWGLRRCVLWDGSEWSGRDLPNRNGLYRQDGSDLRLLQGVGTSRGGEWRSRRGLWCRRDGTRGARGRAACRGRGCECGVRYLRRGLVRPSGWHGSILSNFGACLWECLLWPHSALAVRFVREVHTSGRCGQGVGAVSSGRGLRSAQPRRGPLEWRRRWWR